MIIIAIYYQLSNRLQLSPGMGKALRLNKSRDGGLGARARTLSKGLYPVSGTLLAAPHAVLI